MPLSAPARSRPVFCRTAPHLTIRPGSGWQAVDLKQLWRYRDLLLALSGRDVKLRYRQTALGVAWVVLQPLIGAGIFAFVFGRVAKLDSPGVSSYFLFSYAGLLGWNVFSSTLGKAGGCLVQNAGLVSKVFFPRLLLPLSSLFSTLIDFGVALAMLAVLLAAHHVPVGLGVLLLPVWLLLILMLALGAGLIAAALMVSYRDVQYIVPVLTQFLLYGSPVAYSIAAVPERYRALYMLNPLASLLEGFRWSLLGGGAPDTAYAVYAACFALLAFVAGALFFRKMERRFADVI